MSAVIIRREREEDYAAISALVERAFAGAEHSDGNEHELVGALRGCPEYIPGLSLAAEDGGLLAGYIMFTTLRIDGSAQLALAPLAVLPEYQRRGVGSALVRRGHELARSMGYGYSVVLGSAEYYPRFGYVPASRYGILAPFDAPEENFMACKLRPDAPEISGTVLYAAPFGIG